MLLRVFKNVNNYVSDPPNVAHFWRIRHGEATFLKSFSNTGKNLDKQKLGQCKLMAYGFPV